jgi:Aspartyl protease
MFESLAPFRSLARHMTTRSMVVSTILALQLLSRQICSGSQSLGMAECPLTFMHGHFYAKVVLDSQVKPYWWLVDTGAPVSFINAEQARGLVRSIPGINEQGSAIADKKLKLLLNIGTAVDGNPMGQFNFLEYFSLGAIDANRNPKMGYLQPFDTGGILGLDFLVRHQAVLNFPAQRLFLALDNSPSRLNHNGFENFTRTPIRITATSRIEVVGSVGSNIYSFLVDSGSPLTVIDWNIKEANRIPVRFTGTVFLGFGEASRASAIGQLQNFKVGAVNVTANAVQFAKIPKVRAGFSHPFGGIIGVDLLWEHLAILDIGGRALYLKP